MAEAELPITGYLDRLSARPGDALAAHVSVAAGGRYRVRLMRAISLDSNPQGPGRRFEDLSHLFDRSFEGRRQAIALGSYARIEPAPWRAAQAPRTWTALVWTGLPERAQAVLSDEGGEGARATLAIGAEGAEIALDGAGGGLRLATGRALAPRRWYRIWASAAADGHVRVGQTPLDGGEAIVADERTSGLSLPVGGAILIAAEDAAAPRRHFSGKIEAPAVLAAAVEAWADPRVLPAAGRVAVWDFASGIDTAAFRDTGPQACHGRLVNTPTRAMVGAAWSGREACWRHAPEDYAAIHFHADDLDDCRWAPDFDFIVPETLRSGSYLLHLTCDGGEDWLPFFVRPRPGGATAKIAFLASTFTYQAYANFARGNADAGYRARVAAWSAYPHIPNDFPIYGRSTYNVHDDGAGIAISSRRRPIINMRPGYISATDPIGSGTRHYVADHHLLAWLEDKGFTVDIVTDEDLDDEGVAALAPYRAVLTGSHPEYHTGRMLDALEAYKAQGGRLAYLGGNGFYWRIARDPARPHLIEIRRAEGGVRMWQAEAGEYYQMLDGQLGGLWRRNRRPPQQLVGVGFTAQGAYEATYYRRTAASWDDPRAAWIFAGINEEIIGDYGLNAGGAAGFELDRADPMLGTPEGTVILAQSEKHPASMEIVMEDLLAPGRTTTRETPDRLVHADMVYFETPQGGAVFSVGSITFCGSLWRNGFEGPVSQLLHNVVTRFGAESLNG